MSGPQPNPTPATRPKCACGHKKQRKMPVCMACFGSAPHRWRMHYQSKRATNFEQAEAYAALLEHAKGRK